MLPFFKALEKRTESLQKNAGVRQKHWPLFIAGIVLLFAAYVFMPSVVSLAITLAFYLAPVWLPLLIIGAAWRIWITLKRSEFISEQKHILLELRPPRSLEKTPLAMETVFAGLHHSPGEGTWYAKYILGKVRPWWSLEIASLEGRVHFYIWTRAGFRRQIESQLYAQYPGVQVVEVPDYTRLISAAPTEWTIWGCDFAHTKKDPVPIKTYVEYGLDKVQKEPEQVDPLANLIEFMGSRGKGEYLWLQLIIRTHKGEKYHKKTAKGDVYKWTDLAEELIAEIRKSTREPYKDPVSGKEVPGFPNPTKGQSEMIAAIERNISKQPFDVGARGVYIAAPDKFDPLTIAGLTGIYKQFSSETWNGFKPAGWMTQFDDYPWELRVNKLKNIVRTELIQAYRRRQFFYEPFDATHDSMVMSTEELATVFHIPSRAIETPGLERILSATSEAPSNLPV
jgi:hypothetical protein